MVLCLKQALFVGEIGPFYYVYCLNEIFLLNYIYTHTHIYRHTLI